MKDGKQIKKSFKTAAIIILIIGVMLMNMVYCDVNGNMFLKSASTTKTESIPVPIPPCIETDSGRDYISFGMIRSGLDMADICMSSSMLRERYCDSKTTYTSEDIRCSSVGEGYICVDGECRYVPEEEEGITEGNVTEVIVGTETNCGNGIDDDSDGYTDCADSDCDFAFEDGGCGDFDYSCQHISPYPECSGTCPQGEECDVYYSGDTGWCECMPAGNTACGDSVYPTCGGWCSEGDVCVPVLKGCTCEFIGDALCYDSDNGAVPLIGGYCYNAADDVIYYDECASSLVLYEQKCTDIGCDTYSIFCINDTDYGLLDYHCFDDVNGDICGVY